MLGDTAVEPAAAQLENRAGVQSNMPFETPKRQDETKRPDPPDDPVQEADEESFPASDAPARTVVTGIDDKPLPPNEN